MVTVLITGYIGGKQMTLSQMAKWYVVANMTVTYELICDEYMTGIKKLQS